MTIQGIIVTISSFVFLFNSPDCNALFNHVYSPLCSSYSPSVFSIRCQRDESDFPEDLVFKVNYLEGWPTYALNFSCNLVFVLGQYYNFLRLGREGYTHIMTNCIANAQYLSVKLENSGKFEMINDTQILPIVAVKVKDSITSYTVYDLSSKLRE